MSKPRFLFAKPAVFASSAVITEALIILNYPQYKKEMLLISLLAAFIVFATGFFFIGRAVSVFVSAMLVLGAILPYGAYISKEEYSHTVLEKVGNEEHTYSGTVTYFSGSGRPTLLRVKINEIDGHILKKPFSSQITSFAGDTAYVGDTIVFNGMPSELSEVESNSFDTKSYLRSKNVFTVFSSPQVISTTKSKESNLLTKLRQKFDDAVYTYIKSDYSYTSAAIVKALTLGDKTDFSRQMSQSFSKSGLSHLMCVSGMHLCVLLGMISCILVHLTIHKKLRCVILIGVCIFYILFTGASSSVIRAGIMSSFTYLALLAGRKNDSVIALFFAGAVMVFINPYVVLDIAARLSFVATLGVILAGNASNKLFPVFSKNHPVCFGFISAVMTNFLAVIFTLPIGADSFGGFSTVAIISTLFTSIACEILIILSNILCFLSLFPFMDFLCTTLGKICSLFADYIMSASDFFSSFRYSYVKADDMQIIFISSVLFIGLLSLFISLGASRLTRIMLLGVIISSTLLYAAGIRNAIIDDGRLSVSYYRKNENDRQLCVKLGTDGYIIFNADDLLCTNPQKAVFDNLGGHNYIVLLPDGNIDVSVLSESLEAFSSRYGIRSVYVPDTDEGKSVAKSLLPYGIECRIFPDTFSHSGFSVSLLPLRQGAYSLNVSDENTEVFAVFSDEYRIEDFDRHNDICAYFTRKTKTQFSPDKHTMPDCSLFITRTKKDYSAEGLLNTFGKTSFMLKE